MAELTPSERLQPSLLDRLTDDEPEQSVESRDRRILSLDRIRACVLRDLQWLLNCSNIDQIEDLEERPQVKTSVLNYGIPDLTGLTASGIKVPDLERRVREAIWNFEPRILRHSLRVTARRYSNLSNNNALVFEIEGEMWAQPLPLRLYLRTEVDLDSGNVLVKEVKR
ncbi:MAG TPA: type VI secretion system baseplate subunit TssE [Pirellulaceae bacterium]|nr:type VI secretion system baseplate subunit TssE [Pirellulaceae bacterium]